MNHGYSILYEPSARNIAKAKEVAEAVQWAEQHPETWSNPKTRSEFLARTIHSTVAMQDSELTLEQVRRILLTRKPVRANAYEIKEAIRTAKAYSLLPQLDPLSEDDLLRFHETALAGLDDGAGRFRTEDVCAGFILDPPAEEVPERMEGLFKWYEESDLDPFLKSIVFAAEIDEYVHPFFDGNGITARAWLSALLGSRHEVFYWLPYLDGMAKNVASYRAALGHGSLQLYVDVALDAMLAALHDLRKRPSRARRARSSARAGHPRQQLLEALGNDELSAAELMRRLGLTDQETLRSRYLDPALRRGIIERVIVDGPSGRTRRYRRGRRS